MRRRQVYYGWWLVAGAIPLLACLGTATISVANIYQPYVVAEFGISKGTFALANSIVFAMGIFCSPWIARQYSYYGFQKLYLLSTLIYAISYGLQAFAPNIYCFYFLSIFIGFGYAATTNIPISMVITQWFHHQRGFAMSLAYGGFGIGGIVFSHFLTFMIQSYGWRWAYLSYAGIMVLVCVPIVLCIFNIQPNDSRRHVQETSGTELRVDADKGVHLAETRLASQSFYWMLMVGAILIGIAHTGGLGQFPPVIAELHGAPKAALILSLYSAVGILGKIILGAINDRWGVRWAIIYGASLMIASYASMLASNHFSLVIVMGICFGLGNVMGSMVPSLLVASLFKVADYAKVNGYIQSFLMIGLMLGSLLAASIADVTGSYQYTWLTLLVVEALAAILWLRADQRARRYF